MKYDLVIREHNVRPHLDIEQDIRDKQNGLFTFNLMISQGNIESYATYETIAGRSTRATIHSVVKEFTATRTY